MDILGYEAIALTIDENSFVFSTLVALCDIGDIINIVSASYTGSNINTLTTRVTAIHITVNATIVDLPFTIVSIISLVLISSIV